MKILSVLVTLAACSGGSSTQVTPPVPPGPEPDPVPVAQPTPAPVPAEPPAPVEPAKPDPAKVKAELLAVETTAYDKAKPVFEKFCASCHSQGQKKAKKKTLEHLDITTYPFGGHHAMELGEAVRDVLGLSGDKPTMPKGKPGAVKGDELALIKAWADAFDASHAGGAHEGQGHAGEHHGHETPKDAPKKDAPKPHGADHKH